MSTLYITDLDGTLLDENAQIPQEGKEILQSLINKGLLFTVATARSPATVVDLLKDIPVKIPAILMTGAILYDVEQKKILKTTNLAQNSVTQICKALEESGKNALAYTVKDSRLIVYYKNLENKLEQQFAIPRMSTPYKKFVKTENFTETLKDIDVVMFLICVQDLEKARCYYDKINKVDGIRCYFYPYEYGEGYMLEIYHENCTKNSALDMLKEFCGADKVVAFGDNINDLPLLSVADESYAPENAVREVKETVTQVIGANTENSVAKFIKTHFEENN